MPRMVDPLVRSSTLRRSSLSSPRDFFLKSAASLFGRSNGRIACQVETRYRLTHRLSTEVLLRSISCKGNSVKLINYSDIYSLSERLAKSKSLINIEHYFQTKTECYNITQEKLSSAIRNCISKKITLVYLCCIWNHSNALYRDYSAIEKLPQLMKTRRQNS